MLSDLREKPALYSFTWATALHLVMILVMVFIPVSRHWHKPPEKLHKFRMRGVSTAPISPRKNNATTNPRQFAHSLKFIKKDMTQTLKPLEDVPVDEIGPKSIDSRPQPKFNEVQPKRLELDRPSVLKGSDFENIVAKTEERQVKDTVPLKQRSTAKVPTPADKVKASKDYKVNESNLFEALVKPLRGMQLYSPTNVAIDPEEGMPGFTPSAYTAPEGSEQALDQQFGEPDGEITAYESVDAFLDIEVYTYEQLLDPKKYFMIKISPKPGAQVFQVMAKEMLFAIDCSLSISADRLEEFKKGITASLKNLNQGDLFNIIAFKEDTTFFSPQSVVATPETIRAAERFVLGLTASKRTDMHQAIQKLVERSLSRTPSNIILLTDGRPTHGIVDARELLNSITRANQKARPIFAFSGGSKVNRYLLDFIAYQNRGWSQFIKKTPDVDKGLAEFYSKIKDPIFLNLRYRLNGLDQNEVYPKSLPDFYANAEFTLYGAYDNEDAFSMQLLGDIGGETKDLVFSRSLVKARKGNADVMKGWAFNKIYYLINQVTLQGNRPELLKEIHELSARYGITTPYSPELQNLD